MQITNPDIKIFYQSIVSTDICPEFYRLLQRLTTITTLSEL